MNAAVQHHSNATDGAKPTGLRVSNPLLADTRITLQEKCILAEVVSLDRGAGCYASNGHFSEHHNLAERRVSQIVKALERKGFVRARYQREGKRVVERRIYPADKARALMDDSGGYTWLPFPFLQTDGLTLQQKFILAEIHFYRNRSGYLKTNKQLAESLGLSLGSEHIRRLIASLRKLGLVEVHQGDTRRIVTTDKAVELIGYPPHLQRENPPTYSARTPPLQREGKEQRKDILKDNYRNAESFGANDQLEEKRAHDEHQVQGLGSQPNPEAKDVEQGSNRDTATNVASDDLITVDQLCKKRLNRWMLPVGQGLDDDVLLEIANQWIKRRKMEWPGARHTYDEWHLILDQHLLIVWNAREDAIIRTYYAR